MTMKIVSRKEAVLLRLKRYFTGKECKNGHVCERKLSSRTCMQCDRDKNSAWCKKKSQKKIEINREKGITIRSTAVAEGLSRYFTGIPCSKGHIEKRRTSDTKCMECVRLKNIKRRAEDPKYFADRLRDFHERNPYAKRSYDSTRRARKAASGGTHSSDQLNSLIKKQKNRCAYCEVKIKGSFFHADHILPIALGGGSEVENIQILCASCNLSKGAIHPIDFANKKFGLLL